MNTFKLSIAVTLALFFSLQTFCFAADQSLDSVDVIRSLSQADKSTEVEKTFCKQLLESYAAYQKVNHYQCLFLKAERDDKAAKLTREKILFFFNKPFRIAMHWINTHKKGLQVCYARGKHDNKLGIHKPGLFLGLAPVVFLPQDSPWVREGSQAYNIEDAGIGTFLMDFMDLIAQNSKENNLTVSRLGLSARHWRIIIKRSASDCFAYQIHVFFDRASSFPTRMELYDKEGKLTGVYHYQHLKVNSAWFHENAKKSVHPRLKNAFYE